MLVIRVEKGGDSDDDVRRHQKGSFEIIAASVKDEEVDDETSDEQRDGFEEREVERHVFVHAPAEDDDEGRDKDC